MDEPKAKRAERISASGPIANFERWFSAQAISGVVGEEARQDCRLGLIYEVFRRDPKILRAKLQPFLMALPGWNPLDFQEPQWDPWSVMAFAGWEKPWFSAKRGRSLSKRTKRYLTHWNAAGATGPEGVSMSVSALLPAGESEVVKYIPPKLPLTITDADESGLKIESDVQRSLLEDNGELEKNGWKLFAIDCRSKDAVKQALKFICENHVPERTAHGKFTLKSWASRLCEWNERCVGNFIGPRNVEITASRLEEMIRAWSELEMSELARPLSSVEASDF